MKRRIAITQRVEVLEEIGERRDALSQEWAAFMQACGFLPVLIPNHLDTAKETLSEFQVHGILLTGGNDLAAYGGNAPERDETEQYLIGYAMERSLPLLGVCRGMQMLCHHFGTPLQRVEGHVRTEHTLSDGSRVNSFHGWGIKKECRPPLAVRLTSEDGVVEAVVHEKHTHLHGIMWHPERYKPFREEDIAWIRSVFQP